MFGWLTNWLRRDGIYRPAERRIFRYWNGERWVDGDPMVIHRRIMDVVGDFTAYCIAASSPMKDAESATCRACEMIRVFFDLKPLIGNDAAGTLTNEDCVDLFVTYRAWQARLKKNLRNTPIPARAISASTASSPAAAPVTPSSSASGSTAAASATAKPERSRTGLESLSVVSMPSEPTSTP
jgi:hypothetical protein